MAEKALVSKASETKWEAPASRMQKPEHTRSIKSSALQAKLRIGQPNDIYEQEADRVAEQIMRMPDPVLQRRCAKCDEDEKGILQTKKSPGQPLLTQGQNVPPIVHDVLRSPGQPLDSETRAFMEPRFGHDFSGVRVHTDAKAAESTKAVNALAYTVGQCIVFGVGRYAPETKEGQQLLAHELVHTLQQHETSIVTHKAQLGSVPKDSEEQKTEQVATAVKGATNGISTNKGGSEPRRAVITQVLPRVISRKAIYPDTTCDSISGNITTAWSTAREWTSNARSQLNNATKVASALQTHFKLDPNDANQVADLETVKKNFDRMLTLFNTDIKNRCTPASTDGKCQLPDGRRYAAWVHTGRPEDGITHCLASADAGFFSRESLIETIVHEVAHLADPNSTDYAYRDSNVITSYAAMTRAQAVHNGDSYSEFARELFIGPTILPLMFGLSTGVLLLSSRPRWVIGASYDVRSRSGIEVFDLVGGFHGFIGLDVASPTEQPILRDIGGEVNFGIISRFAQTQFFVDTRLGFFGTEDKGGQEQNRLGISSSTLIGWGNSQFRTSINLRLLYNFLSNNHAVIIGGEFQWGP